MIRITISLVAVAILNGCEFRGSWKPGEVHSIKANETGGFMICKVLAVDDDFVWLSVFTDGKFDQRPGEADLKRLTKWTILWSTHSRMRQDAPELIATIAPTAEELSGLQKAKTMLHRK